MRFPERYLPNMLTRKDRTAQRNMLRKSRKLYKEKKYYTRKRVSSFVSRPSRHVKTARELYDVDSLIPSKELAQKTGCTLSALKQIVRKGEGAYYSSGSRPNQTPQSWGLARLASSLTAGKSAVVDFDILSKGCKHTKKAFMLAKKAKRISQL
jgi:hypothetical protein